MQSDCNIYQNARNAAGLTQERAAELLNISVRSLADYEAGVRFPPDRIVSKMLDVYNTQLLAVQHVRISAQLAGYVIPEVPELCFSQAALTLIDAVYSFADDKMDRELIDIARDGSISDEERPRFDHITQKISEITSAAFALVYAQADKVKKPSDIEDRHL